MAESGPPGAHAARLRTLARLNRLVSSSLNIDEVLPAIAAAAAELMNSAAVSFWVVNERERRLEARAFSHPALYADFPQRSASFDEGGVGWVATHRRSLNVPDVHRDDRFFAGDWWWAHGFTSYLGLPVAHGDDLLAVLAMCAPLPFQLRTEDEELLEAFAAQAAVAIRNARLFAGQAAVALENARLLDEAELRRRAAEEAEARYRGLFERVPVGLYRVTADGRMLDANPAMVQMLGFPDRESYLAADPGPRYVDPEDRRRWRALLERDGVVRDFELQVRRRDGRIIWVRRSTQVVRDGAGRALYYEGVQEDITERKRADEAEREATALRSVAQLANAAAHEINNPLLVIFGRLELLAMRFRDDDSLRAGLEQASAAARRISEIINRMRRIIRLEKQQPSPGLAPILDLRRSSEAASDAGD